MILFLPAQSKWTLSSHDADGFKLIMHDASRRPEYFSIGVLSAGDPVAMEAEAGFVEPLGRDMLVYISLAGSKIVVRAPPNAGLRRSDRLN